MSTFDFIVGTFNTPSLYTIRFTPPSTSTGAKLDIVQRHTAIGSHSWLALSKDRKKLYATCWTEPPTCAAYAIDSPTSIRTLNTVPTASRSGYVCCSETHVYSAGGAIGEAFEIDPNTGGYASSSPSSGKVQPIQSLDFVADQSQRNDGSTMDFGGLRHGAHSADLSPDGRLLFIADIGRNCVWTHAINSSKTNSEHLSLVEKYISPREHDGPRHCWPHPNGKYLYILQEHSSMVDVLAIQPDGKLKHVQGVRIIPSGLPVGDFWADEVRTSLSEGAKPKYLYASTRGLKEGRKGYVAVYKLTEDGLVDGARMVEQGSQEAKKDDDQGGLLCMFETATSGGWANAVEPGPTLNGIEYVAMTDSEVGYVFVLAWDGKEITEAARVNVSDVRGPDDKGVVGAATAVWL